MIKPLPPGCQGHGFGLWQRNLFKEILRWTARSRTAVFLQSIRGDTLSQQAARKRGLAGAEVDDGQEKFLAGAEHALRSKPRDEETVKEDEIHRSKQKIGELVLDNDMLREAAKP